MLLGTLGASLLGNLLSGKGISRAGYGHPYKKGKGIVRAGYGRPSSLHPLLRKIKWIFNTAPSLNKLWNTEVLWKWI